MVHTIPSPRPGVCIGVVSLAIGHRRSTEVVLGSPLRVERLAYGDTSAQNTCLLRLWDCGLRSAARMTPSAYGPSARGHRLRGPAALVGLLPPKLIFSVREGRPWRRFGLRPGTHPRSEDGCSTLAACLGARRASRASWPSAEYRAISRWRFNACPRGVRASGA